MEVRKYSAAIFLIILYFIPDITHSQENYSTYSGKLHRGFIIAHSSELDEIADTNPVGIQLDWGSVRTSEKSWNTCNCYGQLGVSFSYFNFRREELGSSYNLAFYYEPYLTYKNDFYTSLRLGTGITIVTKKYDAETNPENTFFSSTLSFLLNAGLSLNYRLNEKFTASLSGYYNHISNGGMKQPNKGMNFPTLGVGAIYHPNKIEFSEREKSTAKKGRLFFYGRLFSTMPEVENEAIDENNRELLLGITGGALYHLSHTNALNAGLEVVSDYSHKKEIENLSEDYDHHMINLLIGNNFVFGKITFNQQIGFYLYRPYEFNDKSFFQRYELLYTIKDKYQIGTSLKAHGHVAENFDVRLGIIF